MVSRLTYLYQRGIPGSESLPRLEKALCAVRLEELGEYYIRCI